MILMRLELDNLFSFQGFEMNFSYPKKIVNSPVEEEYLKTKPNFRYKKVNILMGANASGKTSIGKALMAIVNFISKKEVSRIEKYIRKNKEKAYFSLDFLVDENDLYRVEATILKENSVDLQVYKSKILKSDSYESCVKKLKRLQKIDNLNEFQENNEEEKNNYIEKLEYVPSFGWLFTFPDNDAKAKFLIEDDDTLDIRILKNVLKTLDTCILDVVKSKEVDNSYIIKTKDTDIFVQNGEIVKENILSSGTKVGLDISYVLSSLCKNLHGFYYCDEKFSFIQSDVEQAILSLMISFLKPGAQLFFTTHNLDLLEMNLPVHSFYFLKKDEKIEVIYPSKYIKKNDQSIRNAVKNDVFEIAPDVNTLFELEGIC